MPDPRITRLADVLVNYSVAIQPGDWVLVRGGIPALPLLTEVVRFVTRAGGHATVQLSHDAFTEAFLKEASDAQLEWVSPVERLMLNEVDALISVRAVENTRALSGIDPAKQRAAQIARRELMETYMRRSAEGSLRWVGTQFPCEAYAQEADMSLSEYEDFVYGATFCDKDDPVAEWNRVHEEQQRLVDWLKGKREVVVKGPNADLRLSIEGRTFINSDGHHNMPSGEIFTGPVEDSVNGWVRFTYPAISGGREVEGVELRFENGKVVEAHARKNEEYLLSQLDSDPGARYLGEFAVGTNYGIKRFTKSILFDEKIGGSIHMAVGAGYPETGSKNKSSIHWDFICDMRDDSEIWVDGELFYKNGQFQV
ncbi:MAG: aminopeptidase [Anaerolineales bacterium]